MNTAVPADTLTRMGTMMVWLGGGNWRDIDDHAERSTYQSTGFFVLLNAIIAWGVATYAVVALSGVSAWAALPCTLVCGLLVGVFGRTLATAVTESGRRRVLGDAVRGLVAVIIGVVIGELAALAIFTGPIDRQLSGEVDAARASVADSARGSHLDRLRADRVRLDERVAVAATRRDNAQVVARCEYNPSPECPADRITGDPGRGQETRLAEDALADAASELAAAREERAREAARLDAAIQRVDAELEAHRDHAEALARADDGLDARWRAMHAYTAEHGGAMVLRFGIVGFFVLLTLLPLLLRTWRGQTQQDRRIAARRLRSRAEEEADTAIAVKRAEVRAARELRLQDELLVSPLLEGEVVTQRQLDVTPETKRELIALPAGTEHSSGDNLPVLAGDRQLEPRRPGPLDALPGPLPQVARAFGGLVRPLVPEQVVKLAEHAPKPLKTARTLLEEVEEFQFSVLRKRKVTVTEERSDDSVPEQETEGKTLRRSAVATRILDATGLRRGELDDRRESGPALSAADQRTRRELPLGDTPHELPHTEHRELPSKRRRALPRGFSHQ